MTPHRLLVYVEAILPQVRSAGCDLRHSQSALCVKAMKGRLQSTAWPERAWIARGPGEATRWRNAQFGLHLPEQGTNQ